MKYFQIVRPFCLVNFIKKYTYDRSLKKSVLYCSTMLNNSWNEILVKIYPYRRSFSKILGLLHEKNPKPAEIRRAFWWPVALDPNFFYSNRRRKEIGFFRVLVFNCFNCRMMTQDDRLFFFSESLCHTCE